VLINFLKPIIEMSGNNKSANNKSANSKVMLLPADYSKKSIILQTAAPNAAAPLYDTLTISAGATIFRGDHTVKKIPSGRYPVFFGDKKSALIYTRGAPEKLSSYVVKSTPNLFHLSYKNLVNLMDDPRLNADESAALDMYLAIGEDEEGEPFPYIIPVAFLKGKENHAANLYLNRRILNLVCRLGFDGWIALPDEIIQRNMVGINAATKTIQYALNPYNPEIAICNWASFLEPSA
jgi:hypothetical protein